MKTFASLFTGFGLVDVGARLAGYTSIWGNEIDPKIAEVATQNGVVGMIVGNVLGLNPEDFQRPDLLHASPVCTRASSANIQAEINDEGLRETQLDIDMATKTAHFITVLKPPTFTLENVQGYKRFKSFRIIMRALSECGYMVDQQTLNAADFGVPQTRRRLIVRAVLGGLVPFLPQPVPWVGWHDAVSDIIHTFQPSEFAPWQLARLPDELGTFIMAGAGNTNFDEAFPGNGVPDAIEPSHTITTNENGGTSPKAFIVGRQKFKDKLSLSVGRDCMFTVTANRNQRNLRAFIVDGKRSDFEGDGVQIADADNVGTTLSASLPKHPFKAFIVSGSRVMNYKTASQANIDVLIRNDDEPIYTLTANMPRTPARPWLVCGRVVKISVRGLARFQTIPDSFILPKNDTLACKGIGNGMPVLMYQRIAEQFTYGA